MITAIDGHDVTTFEDLAGYLDSKQPGDQVTVRIVRGGSTLEIKVTLDTWTG